MDRELLREHVLGPDWNADAIAKHDIAIQNFLVSRYDHERGTLNDAGLKAATAEYLRKCREFEAAYRMEDAA